MKVLRRSPAQPADARHFSGTVHVERIEASDEPRVSVFRVAFDASACTNWHSHAFVQVLCFTEGRGRVQKWGEPVQDVAAGDTVVIQPDEKHWHGAAPDAAAVHLAINLGTSTTWMEPVLL